MSNLVVVWEGSNNPQRSANILQKNARRKGPYVCSSLKYCFFSEKWPLHTITHLKKIHRNSLDLLSESGSNKKKISILNLYMNKREKKKRGLILLQSIFFCLFGLPFTKTFFQLDSSSWTWKTYSWFCAEILDSFLAYSISDYRVSSSPIFRSINRLVLLLKSNVHFRFFLLIVFSWLWIIKLIR